MRCFPLVLCLALLAPGCAEPQADFTLLNTEPESIDPALTSGVPDSRITQALFAGLTSSHPETLEDLPEIARSWEVSPDGRSWTFHLRPSVWSDGTPLTAADFIWSFERVLNPLSEAKLADQLFVIENAEAYRKGDLAKFSAVGVSAPDPLTLVIRLHSPCPYFTQLTSFTPFMPTPRHAIERWGTSFWTKPGKIVGNGAFTLSDWRFRERMVLEKNPRYWDRANVRLERVHIVPFETENTGFTLFETGLGEWVEKTGIPVAQLLDDLKGRPDFLVSDYIGIYHIAVNTTYKPFDDSRVREAFSLAIDRREIVENVSRLGERPAYTFVYPDLPGYQPPPGVRLGEDRVRARALLAEAGFPGGQGLPYLEYLYNTLDQHKAIGEVLQKQWREVLGVRVELRNTEWQVYLEEERQLKQKPFSRSGWIGDYLDPSTFLRTLTSAAGNNYSGWKVPDYDRVLAAALSESEPGRRLELYQQAEAMVIRQLPVIPLYFYVQANMVKPYVKGAPGNLQNKLVLKWVWIDEREKEEWLRDRRARKPIPRVAGAR